MSPRGTDHCLLAQISELWLWGFLYWACLLLATVCIGGWELTLWRMLLAAFFVWRPQSRLTATL